MNTMIFLEHGWTPFFPKKETGIGASEVFQVGQGATFTTGAMAKDQLLYLFEYNKIYLVDFWIKTGEVRESSLITRKGNKMEKYGNIASYYEALDAKYLNRSLVIITALL